MKEAYRVTLLSQSEKSNIPRWVYTYIIILLPTIIKYISLNQALKIFKCQTK